MSVPETEIFDALMKDYRAPQNNVTRQVAIDYILDNLQHASRQVQLEIGKYIYSCKPDNIIEHEIGCSIDIGKLSDSELSFIYSALIYQNNIV